MLLATLPAVAQPQAQRQQNSDARAATPVIVELFTSEGCSDCPPADTLLADLTRTQPVAGAEIIPLEEHVDYWNHAGWSDPYSSAAMTSRQSAYAARAHSGDVYTPEMVVNGGAQLVGGDKDAALRAIKRAAASESQARVEISSLQKSGASVSFQVSVGAPAGGKAGAGCDVFAAVTEDNLVSHVGGGENGGRVLHHSAVVRALISGGAVAAGQNGAVRMQAPLEQGWRGGPLHIVAFVQERGSGHILGASEVSL